MKKFITVYRNGIELKVDAAAIGYLAKLEEELDELKRKNQKLQGELDTIKPVLETGKLKPAVSGLCKDCRFAVKSHWNRQILGCCRGCVCEDFRPEDDE